MIYIDGSNKTEEIYDCLASEYDFSYNGTIYAAENEHIIARLKKHMKGGACLDLGCGTGFLLDQMGGYIKQYVGVDISGEMIRRARQKHANDGWDYLNGRPFPNRSFHLRNMENLSTYPDETFDDIVSLFGSFNYSMHPMRVFNEIERLLKPGGKFFIMAYSARYAKRKNYILHRKSLKAAHYLYSAESLSFIIDAPSITPAFNYQISGLNHWGDHLHFMPKSFLKGLFQIERKALNPDAGFFLIAEGEKRK